MRNISQKHEHTYMNRNKEGKLNGKNSPNTSLYTNIGDCLRHKFTFPENKNANIEKPRDIQIMAGSQGYITLLAQPIYGELSCLLRDNVTLLTANCITSLGKQNYHILFRGTWRIIQMRSHSVRVWYKNKFLLFQSQNWNYTHLLQKNLEYFSGNPSSL